MLFLGFALLFLVHAQNNGDLVCTNMAIQPSLWQQKYPTVVAFNGFFKATGSLAFKDSNDNDLLKVPIVGALWNQYYDASNILIGDLFLPGYLLGAPTVPLALVSRQSSNPILSASSICQNFVTPSPANLIASYSELTPAGIGYMSSKYFSLDPPTYARVFSNEMFNFDLSLVSAWSRTFTYVLGNSSDTNYLQEAVAFKYLPITQADAVAMGWTSNPATVNASRGFHAGRGVIPDSILTPAQKTLLGLSKRR